jgi:hypothetical protein
VPEIKVSSVYGECLWKSFLLTEIAQTSAAQLAGTILVDMTFLRTENKIQPVNKQAGQLGRSQYWRVEYELVAVVDGRNLRYYARWPPGGAVKGMCQVGIAAAFLPGTE